MWEGTGRLAGCRPFFNEARAVNRIEHPSIVQVSEFGRTPNGTAYLVMEFLRGESLTSRLDRLYHANQQMPVGEALQLGAQLADALTASHATGIVHRDMKPGNVMLVRDSAVAGGERAKILDFGIAKLNQKEDRQTDTNVIMGTPPYMSPEQCRGAGGVDDKTDVYALGVMLYEMFCGRTPFLDGEGAEILAQHMFKEPPPLRDFAPHVPADVAALVHRLLAKDKAQRPPMHDVGPELAALTSPLSGPILSSARSLPPEPISSAVSSASTLERSLGQTLRSGQGPRRWLWIGAWVFLAMLGIGLGARFWLQSGGSAGQPASTAAPSPPSPPAAAPASVSPAAAPAPPHPQSPTGSRPVRAESARPNARPTSGSKRPAPARSSSSAKAAVTAKPAASPAAPAPAAPPPPPKPRVHVED